jgi:hypothetical protein
MTQQLSLDGVSAQHIFDQNFEELKLHWVTGEEGADRCFDVEVVKLASSSSDLVGHLNLILPALKHLFHLILTAFPIPHDASFVTLDIHLILGTFISLTRRRSHKQT